MMKSVWTAVFSVGVSSCFALAEEPQATIPNSANKVIDLYNQYMDSSDWHMAELIALGAREKYGEDEPIIRRMLAEVAKAKAAKPQPAPAFEFPVVDPRYMADRNTYVKTYSLVELVEGAKSVSAGMAPIEKKVRFLIGEDYGSGSSVAPFYTNITLVVSTTQEKHDRVEEFLDQLKAAKKAKANATQAK